MSLRYQAGGTVRTDSYYARRDADGELPEALSAGDYVYVVGPRQSGKSSLRLRTAEQLRQSGIACAEVDLSPIGNAKVTDWYQSVCDTIGDELGLYQDAQAERFLHRPGQQPKEIFLSFLKDVVLARIAGPVVIFLDEVDALLAAEFRDDFFATIKYVHNERAKQETWKRLSFCLLGVAAPEELLREPERTPFNVGRGIWLLDLSKEEAEVLLPGLEKLPGGGAPWLAAVLDWTNGHPYFTQRLCQALAWGVTGNPLPAEYVSGLVHKLIFERKDAMAYPEQRLRERTTRGELHAVLRLYRKLLQGHTERLMRNKVQLELRLAGLAGVRQAEGKLFIGIRNRIIAEEYDASWVLTQESYVRAKIIVLDRNRVQRVALLSLVTLIAGSGGAYTYWWRYLRDPPPGSEPAQQRIETGMHTAAIEHMAIDAQGRFLVTGSRDKTVRVWDTKTGTLQTTLRPPIQNGQEGKIYAVAMSNEGKTIAAAGWTGNSWDESFSIYLFDRETKQLRRRIAGLPALIYDLKFSRDGEHLAAVFRNGDLRLFRVAGGVLDGLWHDCDDSATSVDFDKRGRIVTSCLDRKVNLYGSPPQRIKLHTVELPEQPYTVRFAPDGDRVAVGYLDVVRVDVLSGPNLERLDNLSGPLTANKLGAELSAVAWAAGGSLLCAGGNWLVGGASQIRCWSTSNWKDYKDYPAPVETITDLLPLADNGLAYSARDPAWGILRLKDGEQQAVFQAGSITNFRDNLDNFLVDQTGERVQFSYLPKGSVPTVFSTRQRRLDTSPGGSADLKRAITSTSGLVIDGWKDTSDVTLNGRRLPINQQELSRSLAIAPSAEWFVIGTARYLRCFNRSGAELWSISAPAETQAVNISGDSRVIVAAFNDGTIRWYQAEHGRAKELLAFFPHIDRKRWIAWTPNRFYDVSAGAEELFGWHVNRGHDQAADFYPITQFSKKFQQPSMISRALQIGAAGPANPSGP